MSDILSLMGYDIRGDELRAEAERSRMIREVIDARRGEQPARRRFLGAIRDRLFGVADQLPAAPQPDGTAGVAATAEAIAADAPADGAPAEPVPAAPEQRDRERIPVGSRG